MKESDLQQLIVQLLDNGTLVETISGKSEIDHIINLDHNPEFIPNLSIDYLLRHRYVTGAKRVLKSLEGNVRIINGKRIRNVSIDKKDILLPDFILVNDDTKKFILMELKSNKQTEREAITELMAYSHEVKNQIPFLTNYELLYVLISTEFNTLLEHSVSQMVLGSSSNILCLKPNFSGGSLKLDIYIPDAWTDLRVAYLPPESLSSISISLYEKLGGPLLEDVDKEMIINHAVDMLSYEANRANAHGFCIGWKNVEAGTYILTVYEINPYELIKFFSSARSEINTKNPLFQYVRSHVSESDSYQSIFEIAQTAFDYLKIYCDPYWESLSDWKMDQKYISRYGMPYFMGYWGILNDFIRFYYMHPGVRSYMPEFTKNLITYKDPIVGIQLLHYLMGTNIFRDGLYMIKDLFLFGKKLNMCLQYANSLKHNSVEYHDRLLAPLNWLLNQVFPAVREIRERSKQIGIKQSVTFLIDLEDPQQTVESILVFREWFSKNFLGDDNPHALSAFEHGFCYGFLLEYEFYQQLSHTEPSQESLDAQQSLLDYIINALNPLASHRDIFEEANLDYEEFDKIKFEDLMSDYEVLLGIMSRFLPGVFHSFSDHDHSLKTSILDWDWIRNQLKKLKASTGQNVAIDITSTGQVTLIRIPDDEWAPQINDDSTYVLVRKAVYSHMVSYQVTRWEDLMY